jgi:hypothetical protein
MSLDAETFLYVYGIIPAGTLAAPPDLIGLEGGAITVVELGEVAAIVSDVPAALYFDDSLNARLDDLAWVGERGLEHERVLDWYAERGPVIPLSLFSLHKDEGRLRARLGPEAPTLARVLDRLRGRREWGIKLWRQDHAARAGVDRFSPSLQDLAAQIADAPTGRRFLLEKKQEAMRGEEVRTVSKRLAHELLGALGGAAAAVTTIPIPAGALSTDRTLILDAAFLVPDQEFARFQEAVNDQARRLVDSGFELEFTGPWPPYHFTDSGDE